jgi:hypothetical protein
LTVGYRDIRGCVLEEAREKGEAKCRIKNDAAQLKW